MWFLSGTLAGIGLLTLGSLGRVTSLQCERFGLGTGSCSVENLTLWGSHDETFALSQIHRAEEDWLYRISLNVGNSTIPLTFPYATLDWKQQVLINQINSFLDNPTAVQLSMSQDGRAFAYPFGTSFFLGGLLLAGYFGSVAVYEINREKNTVTLKHQGVLGKSTQQFNLQEVEGVELETSPETIMQDCRILMQLRSGQTIPLSPHYPLDHQEARHLVNTLQTYLQS
jgi:hypothetical protein